MDETNSKLVVAHSFAVVVGDA
eukprot:COSAG06_NODE_8548_length_2132_cov_2.787014_1_plen_21_part_10